MNNFKAKKTIRERIKERIHELKGRWFTLNYRLSRINIQLDLLDIIIAEKSFRRWSGKEIEEVTQAELTTFLALNSDRKKLMRKRNLLESKILFYEIVQAEANTFGAVCDFFKKSRKQYNQTEPNKSRPYKHGGKKI